MGVVCQLSPAHHMLLIASTPTTSPTQIAPHTHLVARLRHRLAHGPCVVSSADLG